MDEKTTTVEHSFTVLRLLFQDAWGWWHHRRLREGGERG